METNRLIISERYYWIAIRRYDDPHELRPDLSTLSSSKDQTIKIVIERQKRDPDFDHEHPLERIVPVSIDIREEEPLKKRKK